MRHIAFKYGTTFLCLFVVSFGLASCKKAPVTTKDVAAVDDSVAAEATNDDFVGSVTDLMKSGKDVTCTFSRTDVAGDMNGTVYVARDGRMAGEFTMKNAQFGTMTMHVVRDGDYGYTWGFPSETQGVKVKLDSEGKPIKDAKEGASIDDQMEYSCSKWKVDASKLTVPTTVTFQDLSAQMEQINNAMNNVKSAQCDACNQVPEGPGRDQCKKALGC